MNLFDTQNFLGSELEVVLKILDLEVDLAVVQPPPQQPLLVPSQRSSPSFATLAKTRQGQHTWHRKSRCQHCWLLLLLWLELLLLQLLLLELQLLELLLLQLLLNELLSGSWVPPGVEGKVLLGFDNTRGWVRTVFHGHGLLWKILQVKMCFLPVTLCHRLHDRARELPCTDWQNPPY